VSTAPRYTEVERAIRSVPGVAEASVMQVADSGRGRLRIRLHAGEDPERVSWSVAATLRERFGIALDPDEIRPSVTPLDGNGQGLHAAQADDAATPAEGNGQDPEAGGPDASATPAEGNGQDPEAGGPDASATPADGMAEPAARLGDELVVEESEEPVPPPPVEPAPPGGVPSAGESGLVVHEERGSGRAAIRDLRSRTDPDGVTVTATLDHSGRLAEGRSVGVPTSRGLMRTIAEATVMAVSELTGHRLRAQVDRVSLAGCDPTTVTVVVTQASARGEELLLGASIVRDDVEHAVMRATLDALNRRVEPDLRS
jgi:hypothetical protein